MMDLYYVALKHYFENNLEEAEKLAKRLLKKRKKDYKVWFLDALIKNKKGLLSEALASVNKCLELKDDFHEAWVLKASILEKLGKIEDALDSIDTAIDLRLSQDDYIDYELLIQKAKILIKLGDRKKAIEIIEKVEDMNPEDEELKSLKNKFFARKNSN